MSRLCAARVGLRGAGESGKLPAEYQAASANDGRLSAHLDVTKPWTCVGTSDASRVVMRRSLLLLFGLFGPTRALATQAEPPAMTLREALTFARQHQPSLLAAQARIEVAKRAVSAVRAEWLPQVGATVQGFYGTMNNSTAMFLGARTVDLPRIGGSRSGGGWSDSYPSTVIGIGLRQNVYDFGRLAALTMAADAETAVSVHRAAQEQLEVALQVESQFYAVQAAKAVERAAADAYQRASQRHEMVKVSVERGLRARIDVTRAEADLTRFEVGRVRARGSVEAAQAMFAAAVGSSEPLLDASGTVDQAVPLPAMGEVLTQAIDHDPSVSAALAKLESQQALTRAVTLSWAPSVILTAGVSGRAGGAPSSGGSSEHSGWLPVVPNWDVGLVLQAPVFDGVLLARRSLSQASEAVLRHELSVTRRRVLAEIQRAYTGYRVAASTVPALAEATSAAQRNYEQASARFRAGLSTSVELADAEALRTDAEIQLAIGQFEVARARAALGRSIAQSL